MALVLASKSPRRRQLMALVCPTFEVDEAAVDESLAPAANPAELARYLAGAKAAAVHARRSGDVVIGCDTVVEAGGQALGKPHGPQQALHMLHTLSGTCHFVHTGLCVLGPGGRNEQFTETTAVYFSAIPEAEMARYVATDEPYDKAGAYGIQSWAARWALRIEGCYYNVMGLPVAALYRRLAGLGILQGGPL